jgi:hypothetical protein
MGPYDGRSFEKASGFASSLLTTHSPCPTGASLVRRDWALIEIVSVRLCLPDLTYHRSAIRPEAFRMEAPMRPVGPHRENGIVFNSKDGHLAA